MSFGQRTKRFRQIRGYSQRSLAQSSGISTSYLSLLERKPALTPTIDVIYRIATALGVSPDELLPLLPVGSPDLQRDRHMTIASLWESEALDLDWFGSLQKHIPADLFTLLIRLGALQATCCSHRSGELLGCAPSELAGSVDALRLANHHFVQDAPTLARAITELERQGIVTVRPYRRSTRVQLGPLGYILFVQELSMPELDAPISLDMQRRLEAKIDTYVAQAAYVSEDHIFDRLWGNIVSEAVERKIRDLDVPSTLEITNTVLPATLNALRGFLDLQTAMPAHAGALLNSASSSHRHSLALQLDTASRTRFQTTLSRLVARQLVAYLPQAISILQSEMSPSRSEVANELAPTEAIATTTKVSTRETARRLERNFDLAHADGAVPAELIETIRSRLGSSRLGRCKLLVARCESELGEKDEARKLIADAFTAAVHENDSSTALRALRHKAWLTDSLDERRRVFAVAANWFALDALVAENSHREHEQARLRIAIAEVLIQLKRLTEAQEQSRLALSLTESAGCSTEQVMALLIHAESSHELGATESAISLTELAIEKATKCGADRLKVHALLANAEYLVVQGDAARASESYKHCIDIARLAGLTNLLPWLEARWHICSAFEHPINAIAEFRQAERLALEVGAKSLAAWSALMLATKERQSDSRSGLTASKRAALHALACDDHEAYHLSLRLQIVSLCDCGRQGEARQLLPALDEADERTGGSHQRESSLARFLTERAPGGNAENMLRHIVKARERSKNQRAFPGDTAYALACNGRLKDMETEIAGLPSGDVLLILTTASYFLWRGGASDRARELATYVIEHTELHKDASLLAACYWLRSFVLGERYKLPEQRADLESILKLSDVDVDLRGAARVLVPPSVEEVAASPEVLDQRVHFLRSNLNLEGEMQLFALMALAHCYRRQGRWPEVIATTKLVFASTDEFRSVLISQCTFLQVLGYLALDRREAATQALASLNRFGEATDPCSVGHTKLAEACLAASEGDIDRASRLFDEAEKTADPTCAVWVQALTRSEPQERTSPHALAEGAVMSVGNNSDLWRSSETLPHNVSEAGILEPILPSASCLASVA